MDGRDFCVPEDFQAIVKPTLRHRLILTPDAEIEGFDCETILTRLIGSVTVPR
jgi:MoxR-like ATPase